MQPNTNTDTGIRYGIIAAQNLHPGVIDEIQNLGVDTGLAEVREEVRNGLHRVLDDYCSTELIEYLLGEAMEEVIESWQPDEPVHEFVIGGVKGHTTWLGGALHVWVFESPRMGEFALCSPCVPNCCDLDSPQPGGCVGYDVPPAWRLKEN